MIKGSAVGSVIGLLVFSAPAGAQQKCEDAFKWRPMLRIATPTKPIASFTATKDIPVFKTRIQ